jgi:hypothetical protein
LLLYQFPKGPDGRRVKIWRRLQRTGAVAIKNSVYVLPMSEQTREDLQWVLTELRSNGADGAILESRFVDGMTDQQLRELFNAARTEDYRQLREDVEAASAALSAGTQDDATVGRESARRALTRARKRLGEIEEIDFFSAPGHDAADAALRSLSEQTTVKPDRRQNVTETMAPSSVLQGPVRELQGRVWVTRRGVRVDRIASAWLIRRWIDPDARFRFVAGAGHATHESEIRFDMFDAEFTHQGDRCTFEVLTGLARPDDRALGRIGEIVHDIDLKDAKFGRPETDGIATLLSGIVIATDDDDERIERGSALFDDLYRSFLEH